MTGSRQWRGRALPGSVSLVAALAAMPGTGSAIAQDDHIATIGPWTVSRYLSENSGLVQCVAAAEATGGVESGLARAGVLFFEGEPDDIGTPIFRLPVPWADGMDPVYVDVAVDGVGIGSGEHIVGDNSDLYLADQFQPLRAMVRGRSLEAAARDESGSSLGSWQFPMKGFASAYEAAARACGADPEPILMGVR